MNNKKGQMKASIFQVQNLKAAIMKKLSYTFYFIHQKDKEFSREQFYYQLILWLHFFIIYGILATFIQDASQEILLNNFVKFSKYLRIAPLLSNLDLNNCSIIFCTILAVFDIVYIILLWKISKCDPSNVQKNYYKQKSGQISFLTLYIEIHRWIIYPIKIDTLLGIIMCFPNNKLQRCADLGQFTLLLSPFLINTYSIFLLIITLLITNMDLFLYVSIEFQQNNDLKPKYSKKNIWNSYLILLIVITSYYLPHAISLILSCLYSIQYFIQFLNGFPVGKKALRHLGISCSCFFLGILLIFLHYYKLMGPQNHLILLFCGSSIVYGVLDIIYQRKMINQQIKLQEQILREPLKSLDYFLEILNLFNNSITSKKSYVQLIGILNQHQNQCQKALCPCQKAQSYKLDEVIQDDNDEKNQVDNQVKNERNDKRKQTIHMQIRKNSVLKDKESSKVDFQNLFERANSKIANKWIQDLIEFWIIQMLENNFLFKLSNAKEQNLVETLIQSYWSFLLTIKKTHIKALYVNKQLQNFLEKKTFFFEFISQTFSLIIITQLREQDKSQSYSYFQRDRQEANQSTYFEKISISDSLSENQIQQISNLLNMKLNLLVNMQLGYKNLEQLLEDLKAFIQLFQENENKLKLDLRRNQNNIYALKFLSLMNSVILNDPASYFELEQKCYEMILKENRKEQIDEINILSILNGKTSSLNVSYFKEEFEIYSFSTGTPQIFGYNLWEFKQVKKLEQIMPSTIAQGHNQFIVNLFERNTSAIIRSYRYFFAKNKQQFIFPVKTYVNYFFLNDEKLSFNCLFLKLEEKNMTIMSDCKGQIQGVSQNFYNLVALICQQEFDVQRLNGIRINSIIPQFEALVKDILKQMKRESTKFYKSETIVLKMELPKDLEAFIKQQNKFSSDLHQLDNSEQNQSKKKIKLKKIFYFMLLKQFQKENTEKEYLKITMKINAELYQFREELLPFFYLSISNFQLLQSKESQYTESDLDKSNSLVELVPKKAVVNGINFLSIADKFRNNCIDLKLKNLEVFHTQDSIEKDMTYKMKQNLKNIFDDKINLIRTESCDIEENEQDQNQTCNQLNQLTLNQGYNNRAPHLNTQRNGKLKQMDNYKQKKQRDRSDSLEHMNFTNLQQRFQTNDSGQKEKRHYSEFQNYQIQKTNKQPIQEEVLNQRKSQNIQQIPKIKQKEALRTKSKSQEINYFNINKQEIQQDTIQVYLKHDLLRDDENKFKNESVDFDILKITKQKSQQSMSEFDNNQKNNSKPRRSSLFFNQKELITNLQAQKDNFLEDQNQILENKLNSNPKIAQHLDIQEKFKNESVDYEILKITKQKSQQSMQEIDNNQKNNSKPRKSSIFYNQKELITNLQVQKDSFIEDQNQVLENKLKSNPKIAQYLDIIEKFKAENIDKEVLKKTKEKRNSFFESENSQQLQNSQSQRRKSSIFSNERQLNNTNQKQDSISHEQNFIYEIKQEPLTMETENLQEKLLTKDFQTIHETSIESDQTSLSFQSQGNHNPKGSSQGYLDKNYNDFELDQSSSGSNQSINRQLTILACKSVNTSLRDDFFQSQQTFKSKQSFKSQKSIKTKIQKKTEPSNNQNASNDGNTNKDEWEEKTIANNCIANQHQIVIDVTHPNEKKLQLAAKSEEILNYIGKSYLMYLFNWLIYFSIVICSYAFVIRFYSEFKHLLQFENLSAQLQVSYSRCLENFSFQNQLNLNLINAVKNNQFSTYIIANYFQQRCIQDYHDQNDLLMNLYSEQITYDFQTYFYTQSIEAIFRKQPNQSLTLELFANLASKAIYGLLQSENKLKGDYFQLADNLIQYVKKIFQISDILQSDFSVQKDSLMRNLIFFLIVGNIVLIIQFAIMIYLQYTLRIKIKSILNVICRITDEETQNQIDLIHKTQELIVSENLNFLKSNFRNLVKEADRIKVSEKFLFLNQNLLQIPIQRVKKNNSNKESSNKFSSTYLNDRIANNYLNTNINFILISSLLVLASIIGMYLMIANFSQKITQPISYLIRYYGLTQQLSTLFLVDELIIFDKTYKYQSVNSALRPPPLPNNQFILQTSQIADFQEFRSQLVSQVDSLFSIFKNTNYNQFFEEKSSEIEYINQVSYCNNTFVSLSQFEQQMCDSFSRQNGLINSLQNSYYRFYMNDYNNLNTLQDTIQYINQQSNIQQKVEDSLEITILMQLLTQLNNTVLSISNSQLNILIFYFCAIIAVYSIIIIGLTFNYYNDVIKTFKSVRKALFLIPFNRIANDPQTLYIIQNILNVKL
ncbi:hypothetical protein ABPG72_004169 [Tetrahymena utriculariae]